MEPKDELEEENGGGAKGTLARTDIETGYTKVPSGDMTLNGRERVGKENGVKPEVMASSNTPAMATVPAATTKNEKKNPFEAEEGQTDSEYVEALIKRIEATKPETEEERKKRERREKTEGIIAGIADMGRALSNLYFTSENAPNAYDGSQDLSKSYQQRIEKQKAEREKRRAEYMNYLSQLEKYNKDQRDFNFREYSQQLQERKQEEAERKQKVKECLDWANYELKQSQYALNQALAEKKISIQEYNAATQRMNAETRRMNAGVSGSGGSKMPGYTVVTSYERDEYGQVLRVTKKRTVDGVVTEENREVVKPAEVGTGGGTTATATTNATATTASGGKGKGYGNSGGRGKGY